MSRFKFRFWNKKEKKMTYWSYTEHGAGIGRYFCHPDIVPMEYVGLEDSSGKDIYEEDVLHIFGGEWWYGYEVDMVGVVVFEGGCFHLATKHEKHILLYAMDGMTTNIIGNIHEHEHLASLVQ